MGTHYNLVAGRSVERLSALSDGVFAIAMTLLVLDLRVPVAQAIHSEQGLWRALGVLSPSFIAFLMAFMTLGIMWVGQQTQLNSFARSDRNLAWLHIGFLAAVSITPFSTALLAHFITYRTALLIYWLNVLVLGAALYGGWLYAERAGLIREGTTAEFRGAVVRRILSAQALYAIGALLCIINTYWSIVFIFAVQLNYAIAPRIYPLYRL